MRFSGWSERGKGIERVPHLTVCFIWREHRIHCPEQMQQREISSKKDIKNVSITEYINVIIFKIE